MKYFYHTRLYIFLFILCLFSNTKTILAYGNSSIKTTISYNLSSIKEALPIEPIKAQKTKKESKKEKKKALQSEPKPNTGEWILLSIIHGIMKVYSWIFMGLTAVLYVLMEAGTYGVSSLWGWLIVIVGLLYSGLMLLGILDALKFTQWTRTSMKLSRAAYQNTYYGQHLSVSLILFLITTYLIAFPVLLFLINWAVMGEIILIFAFAIAALVLYIVMLNRAKKIVAQDIQIAENKEKKPINNMPLKEEKSAVKEEEYFQD